MERLADAVFDAVDEHQLADLVDPDALRDVVGRALADVVDRDQVERLLDEGLALTPALDQALERLTTSPQVGVAAS